MCPPAIFSGSSGLFEVLDCTLVLFSAGTGTECTEIPASPCFGIFLSGVQPVLTTFHFADHASDFAAWMPEFVSDGDRARASQQFLAEMFLSAKVAYAGN